MTFPRERLRRLRRNPAVRDLIAETVLRPDQLIQPFFVCHGEKIEKPIPSMPGVSQLSIDRLILQAQKSKSAGVAGTILFGIPQEKDAKGSESCDESGIIPTALRALREAVPDYLRIADVCLCEYTDHGHCGVLSEKESTVENDATLSLLAKSSLSYAKAGADFIAPSDMMDGRIGVIRDALDKEGFSQTGILAYSAKYASAFYGPFREAAESAPKSGDRKSYQMDPRNLREAIREVELDIEEGADIVMVKPALSYLDVIREIRTRTQKPIAAYNVSGEFAMVEAAAKNGWIDRQRAILEILTSIRRAGADIIISYWATEAAAWL